ncbi:binding-protein-dependent transporters inner membrane component [Salinarchaeum sp. Harcht-Bsk1]|uniref:ABC transporter permease n=1 Tax=Salinarchaeum sp. Harcht-Bsk1 TaxID=1333523 RepID=UPI00034231C6|nr:ABC transporter permease [Salinarchaeum sp. Harcht-Bsk1]AGN02865.1 binding-protein-dependent transporters inner membrane component [Salinarchaeum sp. Harcht-Bsk1]
MVSDRTWRNLRAELRRSHLAKLGVLLVLFIVTAAILAPVLAPHDPTKTNPEDSNLPPLGFSETKNQSTSQMVDGEIQIVEEKVEVNAKSEHPLGTDHVGRDVLSRVLFGARTSLVVGIIGTALAALFGVSVGLVSGYYGGRVDDGFMRAADIMLAFPSLVLAIALVGIWGQQSYEIPDPFHALGITPDMPEATVVPGTVIIVVALVNWVWFARVARGEALRVRNEEYIKAARASGMRDVEIGSVYVFGRRLPFPRGIVIQHVLPNSVTPIIVLATIQVAAIILLESALSFLGFSGANLSWGIDISQGRNYLSSSWWIATVPGVAIVIAVVGINLLGDWLRDALDPGIDQGEGGV